MTSWFTGWRRVLPLRQSSAVGKRGLVGLTENAGHENDGPSKLQGMKMQDMK